MAQNNQMMIKYIFEYIEYISNRSVESYYILLYFIDVEFTAHFPGTCTVLRSEHYILCQKV